MSQESSPTDILDRFALEEFPPRLNEIEQAAVKAYLCEIGMRPVFGSHTWEDEHPSSTEALLGHGGDASKYLGVPGAIIGPCIVGEDYYPDGVSVWVPTQEREAIT